ncbi:MAG: HAD-IC family P-type ATPase, partial [Endomicrobiia bacterium]
VFDKTGTITKGEAVVTHIITKMDKKEFLRLAASVEKKSEHHLAKAIVEKAKNMRIKLSEPTDFKALPGKGVVASIGKKEILIGNITLMRKEKIKIDEETLKKMIELENKGKIVVFVAINKNLVGVVAIADTIKEHSPEAIAELNKMGYKTIMITGDNERTARSIAKEAGIKKVLAHVLPEDKANEVKKLQKYGKVAFVGDGINDAPALSQADVGIAIGAGTDVAIESGSIILVKNDLRDIVTAIQLSKYTMRKIKENLFWAFIYNTVGIPIAMGVIYPFTGVLLSPVIAGAAMAFSSVSVVFNTLLMKGFKPKKII